ncbi:MAG: hypothetical protein J5U19_05780 [Candidatus Methanoperedens sp.]|nr:hypothetical protein [Candidatus Methanoperedens sp.]
MEIVKTPSKEEFSNIRSNDKSDRPIIFSAKKHHCILITDDIPTKKDALKYVMALHSNEAIEVFEIKLAKNKMREKSVENLKESGQNVQNPQIRKEAHRTIRPQGQRPMQ